MIPLLLIFKRSLMITAIMIIGIVTEILSIIASKVKNVEPINTVIQLTWLQHLISTIISEIALVK